MVQAYSLSHGAITNDVRGVTFKVISANEKLATSNMSETRSIGHTAGLSLAYVMQLPTSKKINAWAISPGICSRTALSRPIQANPGQSQSQSQGFIMQYYNYRKPIRP